MRFELGGLHFIHLISDTEKDMVKVKAVIFDVDGLLLNTEFLWLEAWKEIGNEWRIPAFGDIFYKTVGLSGKDETDIVNEDLGDYPKKEEIFEAARQRGLKKIEEEISIMPGAVALLNKLEDKGIITAVATTTSREKTDKRLKSLGLFDHFKVIICGDEVVHRKPDPEVYLKVLNKLSLAADEVLVLEDTGYGVTAAYKAGMKVIMVPSLNHPTEEEKKMAYKVVSSLNDVVDMIE